MQNAAFAARGLDWAYVPLRRPAGGARGCGARARRARLRRARTSRRRTSWPRRRWSRPTLPSVNTLVFEDGADRRHVDRCRDPRGARLRAAGDPRRRRRGERVRGGAAGARRLLAARRLAAGDVGDADLVVNATSERDEVLVELGPGQTLVDLPYPETATGGCGEAAGARVVDGLEVLVAQGAAVVRALDRRARAGRGHARAP